MGNTDNPGRTAIPKSESVGEYDGDVREIPYEEAQAILDETLEKLHQRATELLQKKYTEKGDGWQREEPRYHYWKGMDEAFSATHYLDNGNVHAGMDHAAHGLNHQLMALAIAMESVDGDTQTP